MKVRGWKKIFHANGKDRKVGAAILISDKIDFKMKLIEEGVGPHRILPMPQQAYRPTS